MVRSVLSSAFLDTPSAITIITVSSPAMVPIISENSQLSMW